jgi:hypothetical protein
MIKERASLFSVQFERIIYIIPEQSRGQRTEFLDGLVEICNTIEIIEGKVMLLCFCF